MNKSVMARRAASNPTIAHRTSGTPGTNPALRPVKVKAPVGPVTRVRAMKLTPMQRSAEPGARNGWNDSPAYFCPVEVDRRWSA